MRIRVAYFQPERYEVRILEIWGRDSFEVEFVKEDGSNYMYEDQGTFTVDESFIGEIKWTERPGIPPT